MRIAVDDAEACERMPPGAEQRGGDAVAVGEAVVEEGEERLAVEPGHGEEPLRRQRRHHLRLADQRLVGERGAVEGGVPRLALVIELLAQPLGHLLGDLGGVDLRAEAPLQGEQHAELGEVGFHRRFHVGVLELAGEDPTVRTGGAVDLAERGRRRRRPVEGAEALLPVGPELGLHPPLDEGGPHRRRRRLELLQFGGVFGRQEVRHGRDELGELHQRPFEATERRRQIGGVPLVAEIAAEEPGARHLRGDAADIGADPGVARQAAGEAVLFGIGNVGHARLT